MKTYRARFTVPVEIDVEFSVGDEAAADRVLSTAENIAHFAVQNSTVTIDAGKDGAVGGTLPDGRRYSASARLRQPGIYPLPMVYFQEIPEFMRKEVKK